MERCMSFLIMSERGTLEQHLRKFITPLGLMLIETFDALPDQVIFRRMTRSDFAEQWRNCLKSYGVEAQNWTAARLFADYCRERNEVCRVLRWRMLRALRLTASLAAMHGRSRQPEWSSKMLDPEYIEPSWKVWKPLRHC